jgi:hypothetical protein
MTVPSHEPVREKPATEQYGSTGTDTSYTTKIVDGDFMLPTFVFTRPSKQWNIKHCVKLMKFAFDLLCRLHEGRDIPYVPGRVTIKGNNTTRGDGMMVFDFEEQQQSAEKLIAMMYTHTDHVSR